MEREFKKPCALCGKTITYTYSTKRLKYCDDCRHEVYLRDQARMRKQKRDKRYIESHADRIAHQQDKSIWVSDYAERQKQRTLAMLGGIGNDM